MSKFLNKNIYIKLGLTLLGALFLVFYIFVSSKDVISSDYIRLTNYYLEDVYDFKYLFSMEAFSRIPFTFLSRIINVEIFKYSIFFDRILGIVGICIFNYIVLTYICDKINNRYLKNISMCLITIMSFSLMSWELILNGSGYAHFLTMGFIALTFYLLEKEKLNKIMILLTVTSLIFAGSYCVTYLFTIIVCSVFNIIRKTISKKDKFILKEKIGYLLIIIMSLISLILFFISNNTGEIEIPFGMYNIGLFEAIKQDISFPFRFLFKSLAGSIIGTETFMYAFVFGTINEAFIYFIGIIFFIIIVIAIILNIKYKENLFVKLFIFIGLANFATIFLARYKFLRDDYGMSSRYAIQYIFITMGVVLTFVHIIDDLLKEKIVKNDKKLNKNKNNIIFLSLMIFFIVYGNIITTYDELTKSDNRLICYEKIIEVAKNIDNYNDDEIAKTFEYNKGVDKIKNAINIIKKRKLNIFKEG